MGSSTKYNVTVNDEVVETKSKKANAVEFADNLRAENPDAVIEVRTEAGNVVHTVKATGTHAKPWTRTQTHDGIEVEVPAGFTVAYTRSRVGAVVARADDKSGWLVLTEGGDSFEAENTAQAREITNDLAAAYKTRKAEEKVAADQAKADAKAKRDAERAEKAAAKEAEKVAKAEAKAAAKAEKEAAEAAAEEKVLQDA